MNNSARRDSDTGFTLVELLVVMSILSLVLVALGGVVIASVRSQAGVSDRMNYSHNANLLDTYLNADLASSNTAPTVEASACSSASVKLQLAWSETQPLPNGSTSGRTSNFAVAYGIVDLSASAGISVWVLQRTYTTSGLVGARSTVSNLVHDLSGPTGGCVDLVAGVLRFRVSQGTGTSAYSFSVTGKSSSREIA